MRSLILGFRRAFHRVRYSRFARNVAIVATGTAGAQAITMAFAPLITRLYGPEAFGQLGTFTALLSVMLPLAALTYPVAIVLPADEHDAIGLVRLSLNLSFLIAFITAILFWLGGASLASVLGAESISPYLLLIPIAMIFSAWLQIAQQWLIRNKEFHSIARVSIIQSIVLNGAKVGAGVLHPTGSLLIFLTTIGNVIQALLLYIGINSKNKKHKAAKNQTYSTTLRDLAYQHRDFPLYRAPQDFINAASQSLPVLMLASFFGPAAAGFYTLGKMVMGVPSTLVGNAVSNVFYPRITEAARDGEKLSSHILQATAALLAIGIAPFGLIMLFGPWLFRVVFGNEWAVAGDYARWLALFFLFNFINKPSVAAVPVLGIQRGLLIYELFSTGTKTLGLVAGFYWFQSDTLAIALFSIIGVIAYCVMMLWIFSHSKRFEKNAKTS